MLFRDGLCGYNLTLKYPETQKFPTIAPPLGGLLSGQGGSSKTQLRYSTYSSTFRSRLRTSLASASANLDKRKRELSQREWKRDLSTRANGTLDPWYGCDLLDFVIDYALNYTYPWTNVSSLGFDVSDTWRFLPVLGSDRIRFYSQYYDIPSVLDPPSFLGADFFLNSTSTPPI